MLARGIVAKWFLSRIGLVREIEKMEVYGCTLAWLVAECVKQRNVKEERMAVGGLPGFMTTVFFIPVLLPYISFRPTEFSTIGTVLTAQNLLLKYH